MKHVPIKWFRWLQGLLLGIDFALLAGYAVLRFADSEPAITDFWGISDMVAVMAVIHLLYGLLAYPLLRNIAAWYAILFSFIGTDIIFATLIETSQNTNSIYRLGFMALVAISASLGAYFVIAEVTIVLLFDILTLLGVLAPSGASTAVEILLSIGAVLAGILGWFLFHRHYGAESGDQKLDALSSELRQERSKSNLIIESIHDGVIVFDASRRISLINSAAASLVEWTATDALGIDVELVLKLQTDKGEPLDPSVNLFKRVLGENQAVNQTLRLVGHSGKTTIVSIVISPITTEQNTEVLGAVAVLRDITEQYGEEKQRADFISTASHEMRTPVAAIEGYLALALNDQVSKIDSKAREYLEKAHASTQSLGKLFQDLLTSAKAEDGRLVSHPEVVEAGAFLEQLTEGLRFAAEKKGLFTEFTIGAGNTTDATVSQKVIRPLYYAYVDADRMREVITNLFDNAVKYTDAGKITIGLTGDDKIVQLYVQDTGPGIPAEDIPHLFQKFYRVDNSATRTVNGTGLGLFICRKIVELYHGQIWVESKPGAGSTFFINLPRLTAQKAAELQARRAAASSPLDS